MTLVILDDDENRVVTKTDYSDEYELQSYIAENPEVLPLYQIEDGIDVRVAAREFNVEGESADAIAFDQRGRIYIIETKLASNSSKRRVIAQAIDYGAGLWNSQDPIDFMENLSEGMGEKPSFRAWATAEWKMNNLRYDDLAEDIFHNLKNGDFIYVIVMDNISDRLKTRIKYVNSNANFDVIAIELDYYKDGSQHIVVPKMYGTETLSQFSGDSFSSKMQRRWYDELEKLFLEEVDADGVSFAGRSNYRQIRSTNLPKALSGSDVHLEWNFQTIGEVRHAVIRIDFEADDDLNEQLTQWFEANRVGDYEALLNEEMVVHRRDNGWSRLFISHQGTPEEAVYDSELREWAFEKTVRLYREFVEDLLEAYSAIAAAEDDS